jgi:hypothetical protein
LLALSGGLSTRSAFAQTPRPSELIAELDNPETEWLATARLQAIPNAALPMLLQPGRIASGPHDRWTAQMLALAKLGEPAIPSITGRVIEILIADDSNAFAAAHPLIRVLGSMGPAAVPALLQIAETSTIPYVTFDALDEIVRLEPRTSVFGQSVSPWLFWRPADARVDELRRELVQTWRTWFEANRDVSRATLAARRVKAHLAVVRQVPIWEANRWMDEFDGSDGGAVLPLIDQYLDRQDLDASAVGPDSRRGSGGSGQIGMDGPRIVTLALET